MAKRVGERPTVGGVGSFERSGLRGVLRWIYEDEAYRYS